VTKLTGKVLGKINYLYGEVQIIKGLQNIVMIDRDDFFYTEDIANIGVFFRGKITFWNDKFETMAEHDKNIYEITNTFKDSTIIENELKDIGVINFNKERLRLGGKKITKRKNEKFEPVVDKLINSLSNNKLYTVVKESGKSTEPIQIKNNNIIIYDEHPSFKEVIEYNNIIYKVQYDSWDVKLFPSLCKIKDDLIIYNKNNPLFFSQLNNEIVKKLILGFNIIVKNSPNNRTMIREFEELLKESFM